MFSARSNTKQPHLDDAPGLMQIVREQIVDRAFQHYLAWRDETSSVERAYDEWAKAAGTDRPSAFAGYQSALEREEHAAARDAAAVREAESLFPGRSAQEAAA